jgi:hypothetical protein
MEKLNFMSKQLVSAHAELRRVKRFHKQSSKHFKQFYENMSLSLKLLTNGDIYNELHYVNLINMSMIEYFTKHVSCFITLRSYLNRFNTPRYIKASKMKATSSNFFRRTWRSA